MDVHDSRTGSSRPFPFNSRTGASAGPPTRARIGQALGEWQASELRYMSGHPYCRGLSAPQLEDLYQETVLALLNRRFFNEEHIRNALRYGIARRAQHVHRDDRRRGEILSEHAPEAHAMALRRNEAMGPEQAALVREDGRIVLEFVSELAPLERQVYTLEAEGLRYRAIAPMLEIEAKEARKASRSLASKQKRFQLLHDTGRLCGYRAPTIRALIAGERTTEELALAAFAHLEVCASCRAEHRTNARRLKLSFQQRAAALLPVPALAAHLGWVTRLDLRLRALAYRWLPNLSTGGGVRERAIAAATGSGVAVKLAAGAATVVVIAGGTLGVSRLQHDPHTAARTDRRARRAPAEPAARASTTGTYTHLEGAPARPSLGSRASGAGHGAHAREPGGFAFLGVPSGGAAHAPTRAQAASASSENSGQARSRATSTQEPQRGGGPFSP